MWHYLFLCEKKTTTYNFAFCLNLTFGKKNVVKIQEWMMKWMWSIKAHLLHRKQPFVAGLVNLNAYMLAQMILHVLDDQFRHQLQKPLKKPPILFKMISKWKWSRFWHRKDINIMYEAYFAWHFHIKKHCARSAVFYINKSKTVFVTSIQSTIWRYFNEI